MLEVIYQECHSRDDYPHHWRVYRQLATFALVESLLARMDETREDYNPDDSCVEILYVAARMDHPENLLKCSSCQGRVSSLISVEGKDYSSCPCPSMICEDCDNSR